jgi:hypothetical protein
MYSWANGVSALGAGRRDGVSIRNYWTLFFLLFISSELTPSSSSQFAIYNRRSRWLLSIVDLRVLDVTQAMQCPQFIGNECS